MTDENPRIVHVDLDDPDLIPKLQELIDLRKEEDRRREERLWEVMDKPTIGAVRERCRER